MFFQRKKIDIHAGLKEFQETPNSILLDVRTREEFASKHIPHAINVPLDEIDTYQPENKKYFVYCQSGRRSMIAVQQLQQKGVDAVNIGGIQDYVL